MTTVVTLQKLIVKRKGKHPAVFHFLEKLTDEEVRVFCKNSSELEGSSFMWEELRLFTKYKRLLQTHDLQRIVNETHEQELLAKIFK